MVVAIGGSSQCFLLDPLRIPTSLMAFSYCNPHCGFYWNTFSFLLAFFYWTPCDHSFPILVVAPGLTQQAVRLWRQPLALRNVEAQVVPLVRGGVLVAVQQHHEGDIDVGQRDSHIGSAHHGHGQVATVHCRCGVAWQHQPVAAVHYYLAWRDLDVGATGGAVSHNGYTTKISAVVLVAAWRWGGADELPIDCHT